ncbi:MAG: DNA methyltransferase [Patescibacteria group bacterium]
MYSKKDILKILNDKLEALKIDYLVDKKTLDVLILDITRVIDNKLTLAINNIKSKENIKINSTEKETIRKYLLGYPLEYKEKFKNIKKITIDKKDLINAYELINKGFTKNEPTMRDSIIARIQRLILNNKKNYSEKYIEYIHDLQKNKYELIIITIKNNSDYSADNIAEIIEKKYSDLSNYHHMVLIFNNKNAKANWKNISDIAIYMENFKTEKGFNIFNEKNKDKRIEELNSFIKKHSQIKYSDQIKTLINTFYKGISYGFQFKDLFITDDGINQILVMQKIELDEEIKKCPACHQELIRGNSYPRVLYKSFECTNPSCPARSKIGRGKRYDILTAKRQILLERGSDFDKIDDKTYFHMRRDVIKPTKSLTEILISLYTWSDDSVLLINTNFKQKIFKNRKIIKSKYFSFDNKHRINNLPVFKLFSSIANNIEFQKKDINYNIKEINRSTIINGDSSYILPFLNDKLNIPKIQGAVTSPPYYNAREYSQWQNLLLYLIDMMINAKAVIKSMDKNGIYIYNIGDVVGQDNIYIQSNMSKRRQMLGFYSIFIFELIGFKTISNIIWDKGEVQSKRNSTSNLFAGYVNPVNSYEHCIVFAKNKSINLKSTQIKKINSVKKINSKGENILGHTAPYPEEIPKLLIPFLNKKSIVIDPYLGSGTTSILMEKEGIKNIGFEINKEYFELACKIINKFNNN